eukprot:403369208
MKTDRPSSRYQQDSLIHHKLQPKASNEAAQQYLPHLMQQTSPHPLTHQQDEQDLCDYCMHKMDDQELNLSFEELESEEFHQNQDIYRNNIIRSEQVLLEWKSKIDISLVKVTRADKFPFKVFNSEYFQQAFDNFDYENSRARVLPFLIGYAIRIAIEDKIRYGQKILTLHNGLKEIYQLVFKEITGLSIGQIFIERHLSRYSKRDYFEQKQPSKDVLEYFKVKGDYKEFLKRGQKIGYHDYLKKSKIERDQFEHELSALLSTKQFEKAKKKTEDLKYPPMDFYEKFLNQNILESLNSEIINQQRMESTSKISLNQSIFGSRSNSTSISKSTINVGRVSPMLRSVIKNDSYMPNNLVLSFRDRNMLMKSESSVISDKVNKEELPEIRIKQVVNMLKESNKLKRNLHAMNKSTTPQRQKSDGLLEEQFAKSFMKPFPKVIRKRNRFVKIGESIDHSINIENPNMTNIESVKNILQNLPSYNNEVKYNKLPSFPLHVRNEQQLLETSEIMEKLRIKEQGNLGKVPLSFSSPQFSKSLDKISKELSLKKQQQAMTQNKKKPTVFKAKNQSHLNTESLVQQFQKDLQIGANKINEDAYKTPSFFDSQTQNEKRDEFDSNINQLSPQQKLGFKKLSTLDPRTMEEVEKDRQKERHKMNLALQSLGPIYQKQKELRKKMMNKNNIFFNRQIMIEKDLISKDEKDVEGFNKSKKIFDNQLDRSIEKLMNQGDLKIWPKEELQELENRIKNYQ